MSIVDLSGARRASLGMVNLLLATSLCCACGAPTAGTSRVASPRQPPPSVSAPATRPPRDPFAMPALQKELLPAEVTASAPAPNLVLPPLRTNKTKRAEPGGVAIPAPPAVCTRYTSAKGKVGAACTSQSQALTLLDDALSDLDGVKRDAKLIVLESCSVLPRGVIRALRAELAPTECADVLVEPMLEPKASIAPALRSVLFGLALGARLRRSASNPPQLSPPYDKQRVLEFVQGPMAAWIKAQAQAVEQISWAGAELSSYARAIVAIEAGMADMRIVEVVRETPLPDEFRNDQELKDAYFSSLEQTLDPRKQRGRDAALAGLKELAVVGVIADARVDRARALLSKIFGGRRIDALDQIVLPAMPSVPPSTVEQRLAALLPTFYSGILLPAQLAKDSGVLRQLARKGIPLPYRRLLQQSADLTQEAEKSLLWSRLFLGQRYWRAVDFDEATALAFKARGAAGLHDDSTFLLAVALALRGGPKDAAQMISMAPAVSVGLGDTAALDMIAASQPTGPFSGMAALDAAIILQISPPTRPDAAYWRSLAKRYRDAASKLTAPDQRRFAEQRARAAEEVLSAIEQVDKQ